MSTVRVGDISITPLIQLRRAMPPRRLFDQIDPDDPPTGWYWQDPYVLSSGDIVLDMGGFLVRSPTATLLVDCGVGNGKDRAVDAFHHRADDWFGQLRSAGVERADVDLVVFTHLHSDHVGYATTLRDGRWEPSFPNARHLVTAAEVEFWTGPGAADQLARIGDHVADSVRPLQDAGVLDLVPPDHEVAAGVRLVAAAGHTPGNVCVEVRSGGDRALFCGDMVHHAIQLAHPEWSTTFCVDPPAAAEARQRLLADAASSGALLVPAHFPGCLAGQVTRSGGAYRWAPVTR